MIHQNFYPRSPCGERLSPETSSTQCRQISIHALLAESDGFWFSVARKAPGFLSTLSLRRATVLVQLIVAGIIDISIHALLAESDRPRHTGARAWKYFYPRSPCGERRHNRQGLGQIVQFLSTLSLRRATSRHNLCPRKGKNFYPRSPCGERHFDRGKSVTRQIFLSTLSLRRATRSITNGFAPSKFLSTLSLRRATRPDYCPLHPHHNFYPRSPCGERRLSYAL